MLGRLRCIPRDQVLTVGRSPYSGATIWPALRGAQGETQGGGAGALADEGRRLRRALHICVFENK
jgi:hypothetical protein